MVDLIQANVVKAIRFSLSRFLVLVELNSASGKLWDTSLFEWGLSAGKEALAQLVSILVGFWHLHIMGVAIVEEIVGQFGVDDHTAAEVCITLAVFFVNYLIRHGLGFSMAYFIENLALLPLTLLLKANSQVLAFIQIYAAWPDCSRHLCQYLTQ